MTLRLVRPNRNMQMQIKDHVFLVTGAGSGLGEAVARRLATAGAFVVIADVQAQAGAGIADNIGSRARFAPTDVTNAEQGAAAVKLALDEFGHLHGLINCAGVAPSERPRWKRSSRRMPTR